MYNLVINRRNKQNNLVDKMAASKKKSIFDQNFGLRLFMKKKNSSVKKNLRLITKKYIQEACVKI